MKCDCNKALNPDNLQPVICESKTEYYEYGMIQRNEDAPTSQPVDKPICYACISKEKIRRWIETKIASNKN